MRALWSGNISFGLVTIPVKLVTATEDRSVRFNQLRASDHSRVGYQRVAKADNEPVDYDEIVKGYEYSPGQWVVFDKEELEALKPESSRTVEIQQFVPLEQIDPIYFDRSYYVVPDQNGAKAYGLLARAMEAKGTVAVCSITLRDTEHLATLRLREGVFVLATMHWPDEVRPVDHEQLGTADLPEPRRQEVAMAEQLIDSLTEDFDPSQFTDTYRQAVLEAAEAKVSGQEVTTARHEEEPAPVVDLMDALRRSVGAGAESASAAGDGGEAEEGEEVDEGAAQQEPGDEAAATKTTQKKAAKKATKKGGGKKQTSKSTSKKASKKSTAKKSAAKKGTAKKSAAKKASSSSQRKAS